MVRSTNSKSLQYINTYSRKDDVPHQEGTLFAVDHIYPNSKKEKSSRFFRMEYTEFFQRLMLTPRDRRTYYECVEGEKRKPYADIEYEYTDDNKEDAINKFDLIIGHLLLGITYEMNEKGVPYLEDRDCIKISSHGPGKRSMHIIINNWYFDKCGDVHNSNVKSFWLSVRNRVPEHLWHFVKIKHGSEIVEMQNENVPLIIDNTRTTKKKDQGETIDTCVYSSFRQFRLVWNTKLGKDRFLDIDPSTGLQARFPKNPGDPDNLPNDVQQLRLFEGCMITMTSNCKQLPDWINPVMNDRQVTATRNMIEINDNQVERLIEAVLVAHGNIFRVNRNQSTSKNSVYLEPITKPYNCPICGGFHTSNNAKASISAKGNMYIKCFSSDKILFIGKDIINEDFNSDDESDDDTKDLSNCFDAGDYFILSNGEIIMKTIDQQQTIKDNGNNKLDEILSQNGQRHVQPTPIINGDVQQPSVEHINQRTLTSGEVANVVNSPIVIIETTNVTSPGVKEGQLVPPCVNTTLKTFLDGNTKYIWCYAYIKHNVQEVYDSYERYRCGLGKKYNFSNGAFGKELIALGHFIEQKTIKREKIRVVTFKRPDPISNINPVKALSDMSGNKMATGPALSPEDALKLLRQNSNNKNTNTSDTIQQSTNTTIGTTNTTTPVGTKGELRLMNKHVDVRNFWDIYLTQDSEAETDYDNLFLCFIDYCRDNYIVPNRFGKQRLLNYIRDWLHIDVRGGIIKGYKCKTDKEEINNAMKEKNLRRIWQYNTAPYQIGWHNGRANERHSKLTSKPWRKIDVHYRHDKYCKPIPELITMTKEFEKNLPDRVKEIQDKQLLLLYLPICNEEAENLKKILANALVEGIIIKDSTQHITLKNRIEQLERETSRINREEYNQLEESIKEDKARLLDEVSWCCAVRSTFGTGKTFNLKPYIEAFPELKVLIVLPRITLTQDYMEEYEAMGFIIRDENSKGKITGDRIIVCLPSLARVRGDFNLLVIDEFKAVMDLQHTLVKKNRVRNRNTGRYQTLEMKCYNALCYYVANTQRVYVADALLTNAHVLEIAKMRQQSEDFCKRVTVYQNLYQKHRDNIVYTVNNRDLLADTIMDFLREGKRVAVPTNCKEYADFLNKMILESNLSITTSLSTSENKSTEPIRSRWRNAQCIIYTPTILAGNSYEEPIDVVCGYFTKLSCDQADSLQMLMRCRNVTSKKYYICIAPGPGKSPIPDSVYPSSEPVKNFLMHIDKYDTTGWPEEFIIPMDMVQIDPIRDTIRADSMYFNSHCGYMKQVHVSSYSSDEGCQYLFRMLLAMRDAGFSYGGNIYIKSAKKEAIALIKEEKKEFSKVRKESYLDEKYTCADSTTQEYHELNKKTNKTKHDMCRILKYRIKRKYQVDNVPKWLFEIDRKNSKQFVRIRRYIGLNGVVDRTTRNELQVNIRRELINGLKYNQTIGVTDPGENSLTNNLVLATDSYNAVEDITDFWTNRDIQLCENALKILELIGAYTFIKEVPRFVVPYNEFNNVNKLKDYIVLKEKEFRQSINDPKEKPSPIDKLASKVTNKAFGINFDMTPTGYKVNNMWIVKNPHNLIWPFNFDFNDREELRILIPEPTISDKSTSWINKKIHAPHIGAYVNNNNTVQAQAPVPTKIEPVPVHKRIPAMSIINDKLRLASVNQ